MYIIIVMIMMSLVSAHEEHHLRCGTNEDDSNYKNITRKPILEYTLNYDENSNTKHP